MKIRRSASYIFGANDKNIIAERKFAKGIRKTKMKNDINFNGHKKSFFGSKAIYAALAVMLMGAVGATWYAVDKSVKNEAEEALPFVSEAETVKEKEPLPQEKPQTPPQQLQESPLPQESSPVSENSESLENSNPASPVSSEEPPELFVMPVIGDVVKNYSNHHVAKNETLGDWRTHDGVDISAKVTTPVKCVADGVVENIYDDDLFGRVVVVSHSGDLKSYYCNLNKLVNVEEGQELSAGHVVGSVGATAGSESSLPEHLHFAMSRGGEWIDPLKTIGAE